MTDMSQTIAPKSDQLNADDLISGPRTIEVTKVALSGSAEQPVAIGFKGDNGKPFKPCKSMRRVMVRVWGTDGNAYVGRRMTIYRDDSVTWGGQAVGGIRISHMSGISQPVTMALTATQKQRKPYTVKPLADAPAADNGLAELRARARPVYAELKKAAQVGTARDFVMRADVDDLLQELSERDAETYAAFSKLIPAEPNSGRDPEQGTPPADAPPEAPREGTDSAATEETTLDPRATVKMIATLNAEQLAAWKRANEGRIQALPKSAQPMIRAAINDREFALKGEGQ
ncbi:MAG: hypothetical protein ING29_00845 [Azospirillum sp.]|nr:hypothetical protein [Azospirillum sp.]